MPPRKSRMVSFRISEEEYLALRDSCSHTGLRSLSELARSAVQDFIQQGPDPPSSARLEVKVEYLSGRLKILDRAVERLAQLLERDDSPRARQETVLP